MSSIMPLTHNWSQFFMLVNVNGVVFFKKAPLPQSLVNFVTRKVAGIMLHKLQQRVVHVSRNPHCAHAVSTHSFSASV